MARIAEYPLETSYLLLMTPLQFAVRIYYDDNELTNIKQLLAAPGIRVDAVSVVPPNENGNTHAVPLTPLQMGVTPAVGQLLLDAGANIEAGAGKMGSALMRSAEKNRDWNNKLVFARFLIERGANVNAVDRDGHDAVDFWKRDFDSDSGHSDFKADPRMLVLLCKNGSKNRYCSATESVLESH